MSQFRHIYPTCHTSVISFVFIYIGACTYRVLSHIRECSYRLLSHIRECSYRVLSHIRECSYRVLSHIRECSYRVLSHIRECSYRRAEGMIFEQSEHSFSIDPPPPPHVRPCSLLVITPPHPTHPPTLPEGIGSERTYLMDDLQTKEPTKIGIVTRLRNVLTRGKRINTWKNA